MLICSYVIGNLLYFGNNFYYVICVKYETLPCVVCRLLWFNILKGGNVTSMSGLMFRLFIGILIIVLCDNVCSQQFELRY